MMPLGVSVKLLLLVLWDGYRCTASDLNQVTARLSGTAVKRIKFSDSCIHWMTSRSRLSLTRTQPCIPLGSLNRVPALIG